MKPTMIQAVDVRRRLLADDNIIFVSVFGDQLHRHSHLEGAISLDELERRAEHLDRRTTLVFY